MDPDDDPMDVYDSDYGEEDYGYDEDDDQGNDVESENEYDDSKKDKTFTVLEEADIKQRQEKEIMNVCNTLSLPKPAASLLVYHYKWDVSQLFDDWFADEEKVRATVRLLKTDEPVKKWKGREVLCGICFETVPAKNIQQTPCGHPYCVGCWKGYVGFAVKDGPGCLTLRCPEPSCRAAIGRDVIDMVATEEERKKYGDYFYRSYIEVMRRTKWCPAPGCENAVEFEFSDSGSFDVTCNCSHSFCWNCGEDAHRPLDCDTVRKWVIKNSSEAENTTWILANSKPCPKCHRSIEKNNGCMHMTCGAPCKHEFCWLCLGNWKNHGEKTGGFYACNSYDAARHTGEYSEEERIRELAKNTLEKYTHHYERFAANQRSREIAMRDLHEVETEQLKELSDRVDIPETQLEFIPDAWRQIVECRRVLKWSYAYTYYIPEHEDNRKEFIKFCQGEAEQWLERLHGFAEKELGKFMLDKTKGLEDFQPFPPRFLDLTKLTNTYFENLVRALEQGLSVLES